MRIKGELLSARDKVSEESDLLKKPDELVEAVEDRMRTFLGGSKTQEEADTKIREAGAEHEPVHTSESENENRADTLESEPRGPNPRTLG